MKNILLTSLLLAAFLPFASSCSDPLSNDNEPDATSGASIPSGEGDGQGVGNGNNGKMLVVFFSRAGENWQVGTVSRGNTALLADYIVEFTEADVFEIVPETAYPSSYNETLTVATSEKNAKARPKFKGEIKNIGEYSTIFVGSPIWWGEPPMIMHTFCEAYPQLKDKVIVPFGTHGGSGVSPVTNMLKQYYPDATFLATKGMAGTDARKDSAKGEIESWLKQIKIID